MKKETKNGIITGLVTGGLLLGAASSCRDGRKFLQGKTKDQAKLEIILEDIQDPAIKGKLAYNGLKNGITLDSSYLDEGYMKVHLNNLFSTTPYEKLLDLGEELRSVGGNINDEPFRQQFYYWTINSFIEIGRETTDLSAKIDAFLISARLTEDAKLTHSKELYNEVLLLGDKYDNPRPGFWIPIAEKVQDNDRLKKYLTLGIEQADRDKDYKTMHNYAMRFPDIRKKEDYLKTALLLASDKDDLIMAERISHDLRTLPKK